MASNQENRMNVRLIIPNCNRNTSPLVAYGKTIADIAGGFTATQATGGWIDRQGLLVVEPVTVFDCSLGLYDPQTIADHSNAFRAIAKQIARELRQDCVYLSIDGIAEFIR
jgi:hypothetical protein